MTARIACVYVLLRDDLRKAYVGATSRSVETRFGEHRNGKTEKSRCLFEDGKEPRVLIADWCEIGPRLNQSEHEIGLLFESGGWEVVSFGRKKTIGYSVTTSLAAAPLGVIAAHANRDERGKSKLSSRIMSKLNEAKDERGRSIQARNAGLKNHQEKLPDGRSVYGIKLSAAAAAKKDPDGKTANSRKGGLAGGTIKRRRCVECGKESNSTGMGSHQRWSGHKGVIKL